MTSERFDKPISASATGAVSRLFMNQWIVQVNKIKEKKIFDQTDQNNLITLIKAHVEKAYSSPDASIHVENNMLSSVKMALYVVKNNNVPSAESPLLEQITDFTNKQIAIQVDEKLAQKNKEDKKSIIEEVKSTSAFGTDNKYVRGSYYDKIFSNYPVENFFLEKDFSDVIKKLSDIINNTHVKEDGFNYLIDREQDKKEASAWVERLVRLSRDILLDKYGDLRGSVLKKGGWQGNRAMMQPENIRHFISSFINVVVQNCNVKVEKIMLVSSRSKEQYTKLCNSRNALLNFIGKAAREMIDPEKKEGDKKVPKKPEEYLLSFPEKKEHDYVSRIYQEVSEDIPERPAISLLSLEKFDPAYFVDEQKKGLLTKAKHELFETLGVIHAECLKAQNEILASIIKKYMLQLEIELEEAQKKAYDTLSSQTILKNTTQYSVKDLATEEAALFEVGRKDHVTFFSESKNQVSSERGIQTGVSAALTEGKRKS